MSAYPHVHSETAVDPEAFNIPSPGELKIMRKRAKLTQADVADELDVTQDKVSRHENGKRDSIKTVRKMLEMYEDHIPTDY